MICFIFTYSEANRALAALIWPWHKVERKDVVCKLLFSLFYLNRSWAKWAVKCLLNLWFKLWLCLCKHSCIHLLLWSMRKAYLLLRIDFLKLVKHLRREHVIKVWWLSWHHLHYIFGMHGLILYDLAVSLWKHLLINWISLTGNIWLSWDSTIIFIRLFEIWKIFWLFLSEKLLLI